jgi:hypothetical protein
MTTHPSTADGRVFHSSPSTHVRVRAARVILAVAVTVAILALFSALSPASAGTAGPVWTATAPVAPQFAPGTVGGDVIAVDDDDSSAPPGDTGGGVNDQGQDSGDIFTQNAQDQSTA